MMIKVTQGEIHLKRAVEKSPNHGYISDSSERKLSQFLFSLMCLWGVKNRKVGALCVLVMVERR